MNKKKALQREQKKLWTRLEEGALKIPRGSALVLTMPDDKVIATLTYLGQGLPNILIKEDT